MILFDNIDRQDGGPGLHAEPEFNFLNRSARPQAVKVRSELEAWFSRYPEAERYEVRQRFRSKNDSQHRSAFFELFLHELLMKLGCRVEIHPTLPQTTRRPDFLVASQKGDFFYMEAVLASDESAQEAAARARMNSVYDSLNSLESPNFFIGMNIQGAPGTPPPTRRLRSFLAGKLDSLSPNEITQLYASGVQNTVPKWRYEHAGWKIEFFPIPKSVEARGKPGVPPLAFWHYGAYWATSREAIRNAVVSKAGRYGTIDRPYVIAVNALSGRIDQSDEIDALFGDEQWNVWETPSGETKVEPTRKLNGAWTSEPGPRYTRVSAALLVRGVRCWRVPDAGVCLYHNPWAEKPYTTELNRLSRALPKDDHMEWLDGETLSDILGLPLGWPEVK